MSVELHLSDYFIESVFVGKDVAESLGYANASKAVSTHCKHLKRNDSTFPKWEDGKIYAVANDILKVLGYSEWNWRTTLSRKCRKEGVAKCNVIANAGVEVGERNISPAKYKDVQGKERPF